MDKKEFRNRVSDVVTEYMLSSRAQGNDYRKTTIEVLEVLSDQLAICAVATVHDKEHDQEKFSLYFGEILRLLRQRAEKDYEKMHELLGKKREEGYGAES